MTYEVGKKYKNTFSGMVFEVLYLGERSVFVRGASGSEYIILLPREEHIIEFKEPKKGKFFVNVYNNDAVWWPTREKADFYYGSSRLACIEVDWTEGDGL